MSTSYPYLTLSRRLGVRYADVLAVADFLDQADRGDKKGYVIADDAHKPFDRLFPGGFRHVDAIYNVWEAERERRSRVLSVS